jgi:D-3-phosphoglycerate dehydrogenase
VGRVFSPEICAYAARNGVTVLDGPIYPSAQELIDCVQVLRPDAIILRHGRISAEAITSGPISIVARHGVGLDAIDLEAARAAGVTICTTGLASANAVAEHGLALILATQRKLLTHHASMMRGEWMMTSAPLMQELRGAPVSIFGCGRIGGLLAHKLALLDAIVVAHDIRAVSVPASVTVIPSFREALRHASVACIACSLTPESKHMFDAAAIAELPAGAIIVNIARGPVVDLDAMRAALARGHIAAYSTDVYDYEPPSARDVIHSEGPSIATPHVAACTGASHHAMARRCIDNLIALRDGKPLPPDCLVDLA